MHRAALLTALLSLAIAAAAPPANAVQLDYTLYVLGVPLADAMFNLEMTSAAYRLAMGFHTTGLADIVASDRLEQHVTGRIEHDQPMPASYVSTSRLHGQDRHVEIVWRDGTPVLTAVTPPNSSEREEVPAAQMVHASDPMSAIVVLIRRVAATGSCQASLRAYDGRHLNQFEATSGGEEDLPPTGRSSFAGRALRCDFVDRTLAGFRLGAARAEDARERRGTVWLAQVVAGGPRLPVRASIQTRLFGDATLFLKAVAP